MPPTHVRVRFAPSPSGFLHIGSLRTVLFTYLIAQKYEGKLVLRVEDTDRKREVAGAVQGLLDILRWAGIRFDEGPGIGGAYGPYIQSERLEIYKKYSGELIARDGGYRCFCTETELQEVRKLQELQKLPPRYSRKCRGLSAQEVEERLASGIPFVIRQKLPEAGNITVHDLIRGDIAFNLTDLQDHVLVKSDAVPTYQFASVVDDHLMEISHVTRADEWISSFPYNILLYQAFGWEAPLFVHYPVVLNKDGGKLSKRQGDVAVEDYRQKGYLREALVNFCALLGWHPKDDREILSVSEIISEFRLEDLRPSPAVFDTAKLDYLNGYYIRQKPVPELADLCRPYLAPLLEKVRDERRRSDGFINAVVALSQERMKKLSDITELASFFFEDELAIDPAILPWKKSDLSSAKTCLGELAALLSDIPEVQWSAEHLQTTILSFIKQNGKGNGDYLWPLRVALSGREASPGPFDIAAALGKGATLQRIKTAMR